MRCGAACGQGLRTQRSMRMHFLLSAPSLVYTIQKRRLRMKKKKFAPISDRASVTDMLDLGSIPYLAFSNKKGQRKDSTVCGRQDVAA